MGMISRMLNRARGGGGGGVQGAIAEGLGTGVSRGADTNFAHLSAGQATGRGTSLKLGHGYQGQASPAIQVQTRGRSFGPTVNRTLAAGDGWGGPQHMGAGGFNSGSEASYQFESRTRGRSGAGATPGKKGTATAHGLGGVETSRTEGGTRRRTTYNDAGQRTSSNRSATSGGGSPVATAVDASTGSKAAGVMGSILDRSGGGGVTGAAATGVAALGMGAIGGGASYISGGEFGQGAVAGAMLGFGGRMAARGGAEGFVRGLAGEGGTKIAGKKFGQNGGAGGALADTLTNIGNGANVVQQRHAMLAGAGLGGFMFGGDRSRHNRGFNSSRGNRF